MNFFYIESRYNFVVVDAASHKMLTGGSKYGESSFKDFLYKLVQRVNPKNITDGYVGDGILIRKLDLPIILNVDMWNTDNFSKLSKEFYQYVTTKTKNNEHHFIDLKGL